MSGWRVQGWDAVSIGEGIISGINNCVLYIDSSGDLACHNLFVYDGTHIFSVGRTAFDNWNATESVMQFGGNSGMTANIARAAGQAYNFWQNAYFDGANSKYISTDEATLFQMISGQYIFYAAGSGAAGGNISWNDNYHVYNDGTAYHRDNVSIALGSFYSWGSAFSVLQLGSGGAIFADIAGGAGKSVKVVQNVYEDASNSRYVATNEASRYLQTEGEHEFYSAVSGTSGNIIPWNNGVKLTSIGGIAVLRTNRTGAATVKGQLVKTDTANDDGVILSAISDTETIGVFLDAGVANGSLAWIVVAGVADVAFEDNVAATRGDWVGTSTTDAGYAVGQASPPAAPRHFEEIGHCNESVAAGGVGVRILARCILHFN